MSDFALRPHARESANHQGRARIDKFEREQQFRVPGQSDLQRPHADIPALYHRRSTFGALRDVRSADSATIVGAIFDAAMKGRQNAC